MWISHPLAKFTAFACVHRALKKQKQSVDNSAFIHKRVIHSDCAQLLITLWINQLILQIAVIFKQYNRSNCLSAVFFYLWRARG